MTWPANCLPLPNEEAARPDPSVLTNVAPGDQDPAINLVMSKVKGATRQSRTECVAAWAADCRSRGQFDRLSKVYLVGHGNAGILNMRGSDSGADLISLRVDSYRPLLQLVKGSYLKPDAEIWLVGCLVACSNPDDQNQDGPLLMLSIARWLRHPVVAATGYVSASAFNAVGPLEASIDVARVEPWGCPPRIDLPDFIDIPDDSLAVGAASFDELLRDVRAVGEVNAVEVHFLLNTVRRAVEGDQPYDGSSALDLPLMSFPLTFSDGAMGWLEITLGGLAVAVRGPSWRLIYRKRRGVSNLHKMLAHPTRD
ncbi:MAG: hypothetical protein AMXMBFR64_31530 [Myxococcales bacterium]